MFSLVPEGYMLRLIIGNLYPLGRFIFGHGNSRLIYIAIVIKADLIISFSFLLFYTT